jgi:hypothetical protein
MTSILEMTMIRPADSLGPALTSRFLGADLREQIEAILSKDGSVVIDFDGVRAISPSFADEVFAKLPQDAIASGQIRFENLTDDLRVIAQYVTRARHAAG